MQRVMQNNAAVFRTQETLEEGILFFNNSSFSFLPQINTERQEHTCLIEFCYALFFSHPL